METKKSRSANLASAMSELDMLGLRAWCGVGGRCQSRMMGSISDGSLGDIKPGPELNRLCEKLDHDDAVCQASAVDCRLSTVMSPHFGFRQPVG